MADEPYELILVRTAARCLRASCRTTSDGTVIRSLTVSATSDAEAAVRELFARYLDAYNEHDAEALAALHATPSLIVHRGEVLVMDDETNLPYQRSILAENEAEGDHVWEMADLTTDVVAANGAIAKLHWVARRPDGTVLWEDRPAYMVADDGSGWLVLGNISSNS